MRVLRKTTVWSIGVSSAALLCATSAMAQSSSDASGASSGQPATTSSDAPPPPSSTPAKTSAETSAAPSSVPANTGVAEIVVMAQKRSERLQDVPIAVTAVTSDTLTRTGVDSSDELTAVVPGLNLNNSSFGFRPFIRGVGTSSSASGNENPVSTYIDNVYLASLTAGLLNLTSVDSIEVLKGPQGTLFGRNATGGVINVRTRKPSHTFGGEASVGIDNYATLVGKGYVTGGLSDTLAMDLAVYVQHQYDGYGVNVQTGHDINYTNNLTLRSKILFTPSADDTLTLAGDYSRVNDRSANTYHALSGTTMNCGLPDATHPLPCGAPSVYTGKPWDINEPHDPTDLIKTGGVSLTYEHDFPWASLTSISAYRRSHTDISWNGTPVATDYQYVVTAIRERQFTQEVQLSSLPNSPVKWIVGAYYINARSAYEPFQNRLLALAPNQVQWYADERLKSPALYAQVTAPVEALGNTNITGGLRYTIDRRTIVGDLELTPLGDPQTVLATLSTTDAKKTYKTFTWRLAIDHHFNSNVMVYASYNRGFKAGAFNTIPPGPKPAEPEFLDAYEVGLKSTLLDHRLTFDLSAFYYKYQNLQVTIFTGAAATIENAASAEIKGLDVDVNFQATPHFRLFVSGEFLDHKYSDYPNGPKITLLTLAQGGGAIRSPADLSGNPLIYTADTVLSGGAYYDLETEAGTLDLNAIATYNSGYTAEPSAAFKIPSFWQINATAGWTFSNNTTRISVFGKNLANAKVPKSVPTNVNPGGYVEVNYQPPRTYGVELSQKF